jgi:hypothetical protein
MIEAILAAMLAQPQYVDDRDMAPEQRVELYRPIAGLIAGAAGGNRWKAAALIELGYSESRWAAYVLEGRCKDGPRGARCDWDYRKRAPRARGPWQVWSWCTEAWRYPEGSSESLTAEVRCAARMLAGAKQRCAGTHPAGDWAGMFSGYRAASCTWMPAASRARRMLTIAATL